MRRIIVLIGILALWAPACGDDNGERIEEGIEEGIEERTGQVGARSAAETLRFNLTTYDLDEGEHLRDVDVLEEVAGNVPGSPEVAGLEDTTGDGRDDDGRVELRVGEEAACVIVGEDNETVDVEGGPCG